MFWSQKHLTSTLNSSLCWKNDANCLLFCLQTQPPGSSYLRADVEVAVDGQNWVVSVLNSLWKESVAAALQEPFKEELGRSIQEGLLTVWGTNILGRADWGGVFYFLEREQSSLVLERRQNNFTRTPFTNGNMTPTMSLGLTRKSLFPPTGMCFFMRLK